jgi:hypothetical protein
MSAFSRKSAAVAAALSLCISTSALAGPPASTAPSASSANSWIALSAMSGSATSAAAATTAAQGEASARPGFPPLPVLAVLMATLGLAIYIAVKNEHSDGISFQPVSPD